MVDVSVGAFRRTAATRRTPDAPTGLALSTVKSPNPDTTSFRLHYNASTVPTGGSAVTGYQVYLNGVQAATIIPTNLEPGFGTPLYAITPNTPYTVEVSAVNSYGEGPKSVALTFTTMPVAGAPGAPVASPGAVTTNSVVVNWSLVTFAKGAPTYLVYKTTDLVTSAASGAATATSATVTGLTSDTPYSFVVKSVDPTDSTNKSVASNTVTMRTGGGLNPGQTPEMADSVVESFGINWHSNFSGTYGGGGTDMDSYAMNALKYAVLDMGCRHIRDAMLEGNNQHIRNVQYYFIKNGGKILQLCGKHRNAGTSQAAANTHMDVHYNAIQWAHNNPPTGAGYSGVSFIGGFSAFEGINEPNNEGDSTWYTNTQYMQIAMWNRAKTYTTGAARLNSVPIVGAGLASRNLTLAEKNHIPHYSGSAVIDYPLLGDISAYCDIGALHIYQGGSNVSNRYTMIRNAARTSFPSPMHYWVTEAGWQDAMKETVNTQATPDDVQAKYMPALVMESLHLGSDRLYQYEGLDDPNPANDSIQANYGFIETPSTDQSTWTRKTHWYAMQRFLGLMADPGAAFTPNNLVLTVTGGDTDFRSRLYQKRDGSHYIVMWRDVVLYDGEKKTYSSVTDTTITVTLGTARSVALHTPSTQAKGHGSDPTSTPYSTLSSRTSFTVSVGGDLVVAILT